MDAIMGRETARSRQYHSEELDALSCWSGEVIAGERTRSSHVNPRLEVSGVVRLRHWHSERALLALSGA